MTEAGVNTPFVAIACGGTGGHLFPGLAVAEQLTRRGGAVALLISTKDVDQQAVQSARDMEIVTLPAVALQNRNYLSFARRFWQSWRASRNIFKARPPQAVLAMGGFTSAAPVLAAKTYGAQAFLHEANTVPGRANRWLARFVDEAFVGFPQAAGRLKARKVTATGTPVRPQFVAAGVSPAVEPGILPGEANASDSRRAEVLGNVPGGRMPPFTAGVPPAATCRATLGLEPNLPTVLVMGGSQGASGLNEMILSALPLLAEKNWQWLHLTGAKDHEKVKAAYATRGLKAVVKPFLAEMDLALGAATAAVSRAGASSLAEIAAMRLPSLLVPFPAAADNHQFHNARAFAATGAAHLLEQKGATPEKVAAAAAALVEDETVRSQMRTALARWHAPKAAEQIAESILSACWSSSFSLPARTVPPCETERQRTRGQGCPRPNQGEQEHFSAA